MNCCRSCCSGWGLFSEIRGVGPIGSSLESSGGLSALQPLGSQLLGLAGGAANSSIQVLLMALWRCCCALIRNITSIC